jgi:hypothetical protein
MTRKPGWVAELAATGMETKDYFKLENHTFSKGLGIKSEAKSKPVPADPYEEGKLENQVRKDCLKLLKTFGFIARTLYTGGIPTGGGKLAPNPAIGIADTLVVHPVKKCLFFVELKRNSGGKLSPEQQTFIWDVTQCNIDVFVVTSATMLEMKLKEKGYLTIS